MKTFHGTAIARHGRAVLLRGPSGSGKSDLALRLIDRGWDLVADDQVIVTACDEHAQVRAPENLFGLLEIRGLGIVTMPAVAGARLDVVVTLVDPGQVPRMPDMHDTIELAGRPLAHYSLNGHTASAPLVVERVLDVVTENLKRIK